MPVLRIWICVHMLVRSLNELIISTGMSNEEEISACVDACNPDVVMHTNSTYPCPVEDLNLRYMEYLNAKYCNKREVGYMWS